MHITIETLVQIPDGYYKIVDRVGKIRDLARKDSVDTGRYPFDTLGTDRCYTVAQMCERYKDYNIVSLDKLENPEYRGNSL